MNSQLATMEVSTVLWLVGAVAVVIVTFYGIIHTLRKSISNLELEIERLKSRDNLQQQVLDQLDEHVLKKLPEWSDLINKKRKEKEEGN